MVGGIKINNFISNINTKGVLRDNKYIAYFGRPTYLERLTKYQKLYNEGLLMIRCESASIPGLQFAGIEGPPKIGYGPIEFNPYNVVYEDINLTFLLDSESGVHKIFYDWMNTIVNTHSSGQSRLRNADGPVTGMVPYEVGYKEHYTTNLFIEIYTEAEADTNPSMTFKAFKAFPKAVTPLNLNWADGQPLKLQVTIAYTDYEITYGKFPK